MNNVIPEESVRRQLSLIFDFHEIRNSQVLPRFLEFVVEKKLSGHEDEIKEYTIAVKGLGKPHDFNPQLDATVRIHAGRLRRMLAQYYQDVGKNDPVLIDIPKGSYIPVFTIRNSEDGHTEPSSQKQQSFTSKEASNGHGSAHQKPVLAVLPFHNLSSDNSKDFFVIGIGEQMSTDLARFQNISVISYFSTSKFDAALKDLQAMKNTVNVDYVLTGSVRFINEVVKMNVQLILAENGEIIFTETFNRYLTPENIFHIQDEIVSQVLNAIADDNGIIIMNKARASPPSRAKTLSTQEAIYKYFDYTWDYDGAKFKEAIEALEKAVEAEPENALANALLGGLYMDMYISSVEEDKSLLNNATALSRSAIKLDPTNQHAQKVMAWSTLLSGKKEKSLDVIEHCIKLNPKASSIVSTMALAYICQGYYDEGFKWLLECFHLNHSPSTSSKISFSLFYFHSGNYEESLKWIERIVPLETPFLSLLSLSLYGKINKKKKDPIDKNILDLKERAYSIIGRMVYDEALKAEIMDGLRLAGLSVK